MFITKMHLSRRTVLRGLGATLALPLLDSMVPALTALEQDGRGAGAAARRVLRAERHVDAVLVAEGRGAARRSCRRRCSRWQRSRTSVLLVRRPGRRGGQPGQGRRRPRAVGRHVPDLRAVQDHVRRRRLRGGVDGSDRGAGAREGDAARLARARHRVERDARRLRRRRELRLHQHDRLAHADHAAADRERPARRVRAAVRHERQHRSAARLARMQRDRSILDFVGDEIGEPRAASSGRGDKVKLDEYLESVRDIERRIQMAEQQNSRELPVVDQPIGMPERLRRARQADDGPAGARLSDRPDARQHVHAGARGQRPRLSGDRRLRLAPPAVAPPGRAGQARAAAQDQRVPLPAVRAIWSRSWRRCPKATARCSTTRCSSTAPASATATRTSTTTCRSRWSAAQAAGIKGGRYVRYPKGTPLANLHVTMLDKLGVQVEKFGDSTGRLDRIVNV